MFDRNGMVEQKIRELILQRQPAKIIETGTFYGTGSTQIIASALRELGAPSKFYTIECNPGFAEAARSNLRASGLDSFVEVLVGLSVPTSMLPTPKLMMSWLASQPENLFDDLQKERNCSDYITEISYQGADNLMYSAMEQFEFKPDLVLLDSAGCLGPVEFNYFLKLLRGTCVLILDDALTHVKHYDNCKYMKKRPRQFKKLFEVEERYGVVAFEVIKK
jgi:predicted O-methyltransferase YrrM